MFTLFLLYFGLEKNYGPDELVWTIDIFARDRYPEKPSDLPGKMYGSARTHAPKS